MQKIIYTQTDEAPVLATYSLFPIMRKFLSMGGISLELRDISLAGRILARFGEYLNDDQHVEDALAALGEMVGRPEANIIKLPNISASTPQLEGAVKELQAQGLSVPDVPGEGDFSGSIGKRYAGVLGSAVNPVLREGNSDRRVAISVKEYARQNPHSMGSWSKESKTHISSLAEGDFYSSEQSVSIERSGAYRIEFSGKDKQERILKDDIPVDEGDIVDSAVMSKELLCQFFADEMKKAKDERVLLSLHLKATMMKVSDPIIFGHAIETYFKDVFRKHENVFATLGIVPRNGLADLYRKIESLELAAREEIKKDIESCYAKGPELAMVDSDKGITNFHVPSDVIIDASMPACIRNSGKMWGRRGDLQDTKALIPDRCYAGMYQEVINFCKQHGAFDPATMGSVANMGLMAKKAEEYGSHDKTFELEEEGVIRIFNDNDEILMEHKVGKGDIFRVCQTKDEAIADWVKSSVVRAQTSGQPIVFWLDQQRAHDGNLIERVNFYLHQERDIEKVEHSIRSPQEAMVYTLERVAQGKDTIAVTGNVLRDYLTDLFPILELGTSAKMLSIVRLLKGGGLFETGAGGTAPRHVQQFLEENHLRWDSLGEFLAMSVSLQDLGEKTKNSRILRLAETLDRAIGRHLSCNRSPSRKTGEIDTRGSHFYLALYWAQELALVEPDSNIQGFSRYLEENEAVIMGELNGAQGGPVDVGGYYRPCPQKTSAIMRPSGTLNKVIDP